MLDHILPRLRGAAYAAACMFNAETRGMVRAMHQRGRPVLEFDARGAVRCQHGTLDDTDGPIVVQRSQAIATDPRAQGTLAKAIYNASIPRGRQSLVLLTDRKGQRHVFQLMPVHGNARDVFLATCAIGILIGRPRTKPLVQETELPRALFGLTLREAQIAGLLCGGHSTQDIASQLDIVPETVRFHLKAVFDKTGCRRRSDVVALMTQLTH